MKYMKVKDAQSILKQINKEHQGIRLNFHFRLLVVWHLLYNGKGVGFESHLSYMPVYSFQQDWQRY